MVCLLLPSHVSLIEFLRIGISKETADVEWERRLSGWMAVDGFSEFVALLRAMLKMDPSARPSAAEILSHPWFAGTDSG